MKNIIAIGTSGNNSGVKTRAEAMQWAQQHLLDFPKATKVFLAQVTETVERTAPPITVSRYAPEAPEPTVPKLQTENA